MRKGRIPKVKHYFPDFSKIQLRIEEKFGVELIEQKRQELCANCAEKPKTDNCNLYPITTNGNNCPYFRKI